MDAQPLRILVVDDRQDAADSLAMLLGITGHEVHVAYDSHDCLAKASATRYDAVLLDIGMPKLDGYRVATQIREKSACQDSLVIAVTGYADDAHRQRSQHAGFDDYLLVKPVDPAELMAKLSRPGSRSPLEKTPVAYQR